MSDRYEFTSVCALDAQGERYYIFDRDHYAGGCEYSTTIMVGEREYAISAYPLENLTEEKGEKLPELKVQDLESYFTDTPTEAIRQVLALNHLEEPIAQLVMVVQHSVSAGFCYAECYNVNAFGTERLLYEEIDLTGDDCNSRLEHMVDDAWYNYHRKVGDLEEADAV